MVKKTDMGLFSKSTEQLYQDLRAVLEEARRNDYRAVNSVMVKAYWQVGRLIVEYE